MLYSPLKGQAVFSEIFHLKSCRWEVIMTHNFWRTVIFKSLIFNSFSIQQICHRIFLFIQSSQSSSSLRRSRYTAKLNFKPTLLPSLVALVSHLASSHAATFSSRSVTVRMFLLGIVFLSQLANCIPSCVIPPAAPSTARHIVTSGHVWHIAGTKLNGEAKWSSAAWVMIWMIMTMTIKDASPV